MVRWLSVGTEPTDNQSTVGRHIILGANTMALFAVVREDRPAAPRVGLVGAEVVSGDASGTSRSCTDPDTFDQVVELGGVFCYWMFMLTLFSPERSTVVVPPGVACVFAW